MPQPQRYDHEEILRLRAQEVPWDEIAEQMGGTSGRGLQSTFAHWAKRVGITDTSPQHLRLIAPSRAQSLSEEAGSSSDSEAATDDVLLTVDQVSRITSLEDLISFFRVDTEAWEISHFKVNKWEQHSVKKGVTPLYQVAASLSRKMTPVIEAARADILRALEELAAGSEHHDPLPSPDFYGADPVLALVAINDPHLGMKAWGSETGGPSQDLSIAVADYDRAVDDLFSLATIYPVAEVLFVVGNDFFHADMVGLNQVGGTTARGTAQDVDTRLDKMFTEGRKAVIRAIYRALQLGAPVRVRLVPGNHDPAQIYRLGEVIAAWFRNDQRVIVEYGPRKRSFYGWGSNAWMFTHGEEYKRHRDNLALIFATECDPEIWVQSTHREVITGHWHKAMAGRYLPTEDLDEHRGIRVRALPGLTAADAWHTNSGFRHQRAATLICYRHSGGVVGLHEHSPTTSK